MDSTILIITLLSLSSYCTVSNAVVALLRTIAIYWFKLVCYVSRVSLGLSNLIRSLPHARPALLRLHRRALLFLLRSLTLWFIPLQPRPTVHLLNGKCVLNPKY